MKYYLVFVYDDVEPEIHGHFPSWPVRDEMAIELRDEYGKNHGIYSLDIDDSGKPKIAAYSGGFFEKSTPQPNKTIKCSLCGELCDFKLAHLHNGKYIGHECCWDERLKASE